MLFFLLILMSTRDVCCLEMMQRSVSGCTVLLQCKYCYRNSQTFIWSGWTQQSLKRCHYYCGATSVYRGSLDACISRRLIMTSCVFKPHLLALVSFKAVWFQCPEWKRMETRRHVIVFVTDRDCYVLNMHQCVFVCRRRKTIFFWVKKIWFSVQGKLKLF